MTTLYHPRPERWPQVSCKGLLVLTTLSCVLSASVLPGAYRAWRLRNITVLPLMPHCEQVDLFHIHDNRPADVSSE
jgi:hypothetical protein